MKYALISPMELVENGYRVAEVSASMFEVALPLFWQECEDDVTSEGFYFDPSTHNIVPMTPIVFTPPATPIAPL